MSQEINKGVAEDSQILNDEIADPRPKTLQDEIAQLVREEQRLNELNRQQELITAKELWQENHPAETLRAQAIIAGIRDKVLAPDRRNWKALMTLGSAEVQCGVGGPSSRILPRSFSSWRCSHSSLGLLQEELFDSCNLVGQLFQR